MYLNQYSYAHKKLRMLLAQFETLTQLKLFTDLDNEFSSVKFCSNYSYVVFDYDNDAILTLSIKLNDAELKIADDILFCLSWLHIPEKYPYLFKHT